MAYACVVFIDGSSSRCENGAELILYKKIGLKVDVSPYFEFPTTSDQVEYEGVIVDLTIVIEMGANCIKLRIDSQNVISEIKVETLTNEPQLQ